MKILHSNRVTDRVKPAMPVHALVRAPFVFLEGFTALEIVSTFDNESASAEKLTATAILQ